MLGEKVPGAHQMEIPKEAPRECEGGCGETEPYFGAWEMEKDKNGDFWCTVCVDEHIRLTGKNIFGEDCDFKKEVSR
jgi:hypothetical protein